MNASITLIDGARRDACRSDSASAAVNPIGFSHSTCFPASIAFSDQGTWRSFGSGM